ncbi:site-specific integrase [Sphingopyxis sp. DBS4]|uniref:tyrosine-type recombinase/integrase n=1 Tax=Sphingopyxis sp. DBS4 TaxID=2968500 RepID=UPI00214BC51D|nr:site-specific integrase [Sphingopyxis sp. DBS4]
MLTVRQIQSLRPRPKPYKVYDGNGLFLLIQPNGSRLWRFRYRLYGQERRLSLGKYPIVGLRAARAKCFDVRDQLAAGLDPAVARRNRNLETIAACRVTFRAIADEYIAKMEAEGKALTTLAKLRWFRDLLDPHIGAMPIGGVSPHDLLSALKTIERRGHHETATRTRGFAGRIFRYAIATLRAEHNQAEVLRGALLVPRVTHRAAIVDPRHVGELLRAIDRYSGRPETRIALQLAPHVFLRPGELRTAEWSDIDFEEAVWTIPATRTKMRRPHAVPLSKQALALLEQLRTIGNPGRFLFPALHNWQQPICENNLNNALRRLGYEGDEMTAHGFRAMASTLLNQSSLWNQDAIERALAHYDPDPVRAAYNRASYWDERVRMAQWWSDHLDGLRDVGNVIHVDFRRGRSASLPAWQER